MTKRNNKKEVIKIKYYTTDDDKKNAILASQYNNKTIYDYQISFYRIKEEIRDNNKNNTIYIETFDWIHQLGDDRDEKDDEEDCTDSTLCCCGEKKMNKVELKELYFDLEYYLKYLLIKYEELYKVIDDDKMKEECHKDIIDMTILDNCVYVRNEIYVRVNRENNRQNYRETITDRYSRLIYEKNDYINKYEDKYKEYLKKTAKAKVKETDLCDLKLKERCDAIGEMKEPDEINYKKWEKEYANLCERQLYIKKLFIKLKAECRKDMLIEKNKSKYKDNIEVNDIYVEDIGVEYRPLYQYHKKYCRDSDVYSISFINIIEMKNYCGFLKYQYNLLFNTLSRSATYKNFPELILNKYEDIDCTFKSGFNKIDKPYYRDIFCCKCYGSKIEKLQKGDSVKNIPDTKLDFENYCYDCYDCYDCYNCYDNIDEIKEYKDGSCYYTSFIEQEETGKAYWREL